MVQAAKLSENQAQTSDQSEEIAALKARLEDVERDKDTYMKQYRAYKAQTAQLQAKLAEKDVVEAPKPVVEAPKQATKEVDSPQASPPPKVQHEISITDSFCPTCGEATGIKQEVRCSDCKRGLGSAANFIAGKVKNCPECNSKMTEQDIEYVKRKYSGEHHS